jgi:hypothetical protein
MASAKCLLPLLVLVACTGVGQTGLGASVFHYVDARSKGELPGHSPAAPTAIMVGGRFELTSAPPSESGTGTTTAVESALSERALATNDGGWTIVAPGFATFVVRRGGNVVDFLNLRGERATKLVLTPRVADVDVDVDVEPWADDRRLAGDPTNCVYTSSAPTVAFVQSSRRARFTIAQGGSDGVATVRATCSPLEGELRVSVIGGLLRIGGSSSDGGGE